MNHEVGGMGQAKGKATKQKAKQNHEGKSAQQWHNYTCPQQSSAGQQISQLTLIIDNLITNSYSVSVLDFYLQLK